MLWTSVGCLAMASAVDISAGAATSVAAAAAVSIGVATPVGTAGLNPTTSQDKTEINDAVTKVLEGYDWTLVPIATK